MKVKKQVLIFLVGVLFLVITTFVLHDRFKAKNVEEGGELPKITSKGKDSISVSTNSLETIENSDSAPKNPQESIENSNYKIYRKDEIKFQDLRCVSKKTYEKIAEICSKIDFMGKFKPINLEENLFYREQYLKVLKGEKSYINKLEERGYSEVVEFSSENMEKYTYCFFEMNEDEVPELMVFGNRMRYNYIFSFDIKINKVELLDVEKAGSYFLGNNKWAEWLNGTGATYIFYEIDENGDKNYIINFHSEGYLNDITKEEEAVYMVGFGEDSEEFENFKSIAKKMGEQLFDENSTYYLRISKEQYDQITQNYFKSRKLAKENIKEVTYTFDELFGHSFDLSPLKK